MAGIRMLVVVLVAAVSVLAGAGSASASTLFRTFVAPVTGSDANDCSRAAPCSTLQRAVNQLQAHGTVTVLESGVLGQGATITKAVTVNVPAGIDAGLSRSTGTLLLVSAPSDAIVTINGMSFDGHGSAQYGIHYTSGLALFLNRVQITDFGANSDGVFEDAGAVNVHLKVSLDDSFIAGATFGVDAEGFGSTSTAFLSIDHSRLRGNGSEVVVEGTARALIANAVLAGNGVGFGLLVRTGAATATIVGSMISDNNFGIGTEGTKIYVSRCMIAGNNTGLDVSAGGLIYTGGDNVLIGNGTDGSFNGGPIPLR